VDVNLLKGNTMLSERGVEIRRLRDKITEIHEDWVEEMQSQVPFNPEDHEEGSDYGQHHVVMGASAEQEMVYQARIAPLERRIQEILDTPPEWEADLLSKASDTILFQLATNGSAVQMLVKTDLDEGLMWYREGGEWVPVKPGDDLPALDDADLIEVIGDATEIWDEKEGGEATLPDFEKVALDGI
jgi:hypothetical protein